ncbi:MAG: PEGA domain-containing protein, partial [Spartobacteria bacterium]|nr:PEGA domain-containing protein [Spartobacteria bacterium]
MKSVAALFLVLGAFLLPTTAAFAGSISGTVTGPDGVTGLRDLYVGCYGWDGAGWTETGYAYTDENGLYEIGGLASGSYRVVFDDWMYGYLSETYNDIPGGAPANGTDVAVVAGATTAGIDAVLSEGAKITGTVTGPDGITPLENIQVVAYSWNSEYGYWEWITSANTGADGSYEIGGLAPETYRVEFQGSGYYQGQYFDGATDVYEAQDILVIGSETVGDIDASLAAAGKIAGKVTQSDGTTGLADAYAESYLWNGSYWQDIGRDWADADGFYEIGGLAAGTYRVVFNDWNYGYLSETYDDVPGWNPSRGANVVVVVGETTGNINAALALPARISGTVTGPGAVALANVQVESYRWDGAAWRWAGWTTTDADGRYEIGELTAGTYRLDFEPGGDYVPASLADVVVAAEALSENNDVELLAYARLSGTVFLADGVTPVGGVRVYVRDGASNMVWRQSSADGSYAFGSLRPGDFSVVATPAPNLGLLGEWYDDGGLYVPGQDEPPPEAAVIALNYGDVRTGVDFDLDPAGRISGTVTAEGGLPLDGARVKAKNGAYGLIRETATDETGAYELMGLLPGDHTLKAGAEDYRDEWWFDATHEDRATPIAVVGGSDLTHDFVLLPGQNPALVEIVSDPSGATIYLDYQATTNVTPALVDVGEVASHAPRLGGWAVASHVVTLKMAGHPRAIPRVLPAVEAETVSITIDMTSTAEGGLSVVTDPAGAEVYVDYADVADGVTPLAVGSLAPGSHTVLLKKAGYLQPRPIVAHVEAGITNEIVVPLAEIFSPDRIMAELQSSPTGAVVYVDYFPTPEITDVVIDWMDPASHSGSGWRSASHTVMLRKPFKLPGAPRYVPDVTNAVQTNRVYLIED